MVIFVRFLREGSVFGGSRSTAFGLFTLITSAPNSKNIFAAKGPGPIEAISNTRTPASGFII